MKECPTKSLENEMQDCPEKWRRNELKDSQMTEETVGARRQTTDAWCGPKEGEWWVAAMASMASMASVASLDWWCRLAPIVSVMKMVLRASVALFEAQRNVVDEVLGRDLPG